MLRRPRVRTARDARIDAARGTASRRPEDGWLEKIVTYIPTEIVGAYVAIVALLGEPGDLAGERALWISFLALLAFTPLYVLYAASRPGLPRPAFQALAAMLAFAAWAAALGGPFRTLEGYEPRYGAAVMILVSLLLPLLERAWQRLTGAEGRAANG
jgi:hypothetical protein